jgi:hypothetical protein
MPKPTVHNYLFKSMIDDGGQISFGDLGKHLTDSTADVILTPFLGHWAAMECLSGRVAFNLLLDPVLSIGGRSLLEAALFVVGIPKFTACELYDLEWKMVSYAVDVVGKLLGIGVGLVLRLGLWDC